HFRRIAHGRQVVGLVPVLQLLQVTQQHGNAVAIRLHPKGFEDLFQALLESGESGIDHAAWRPRACRFRCTSSSETAAGVTPDIRAACPTVAGREVSRRWRTSVDKPATLA